MDEKVERKIIPPDAQEFYENVPLHGSETYSLSGIFAQYVKDGADKNALAEAAMENLSALLNVSQPLIDAVYKYWGDVLLSTSSAHAWFREAGKFTDDQLLTAPQAGYLFVNALRQKKFPKQIFANIYDNWARELQVKRVALAFEFKDAKTNYLERLRAGNLYFKISPEQLKKFEERLGKIQFGIVDPTDFYHLSIYGTYFPHTASVKPKPDEDEKDRKSTYDHELSHGVLSGRLLHEHQKGRSKDISPTKAGLRTHSYKFSDYVEGKVVRKDDKMAWLDEAATELISSWISGREPDTYLKEVGVLKALIDDGLHPQILFDAYAEDYHPGQKGLPAVKKLMQEIFRIRGKKWFYETQRIFSGTAPDAH